MNRRRESWIAGFVLLFPLVANAADLTISAAASLKDAFAEIATAYESVNAPDKVLLNFGASGQLLQQIVQGAPVDLFASADEVTMDAAEKQGLIVEGSRRDFARNRLVVIMPAASSLPWHRLTDLLRSDLQRVAIGNPDSVPAGRYAKEVLQTARLWTDLQPKLVTAQNVRQVLDYVTRDEVDAGFVYATDAIRAGNRVKVVESPATGSPVLYPLAVLKASANVAAATRFSAFVSGATGRYILGKYGFESP